MVNMNRRKGGDSDGRTSSGLSAFSIHFRPCSTIPGAGTGVASAIVILAALPCDAPAPTRWASRTVTSCPSRISSYALPSPTMPPPTTTIFTTLLLLGC